MRLHQLLLRTGGQLLGQMGNEETGSTAKMTHRKTAVTFLRLPFDIHFEVARHLDYHSVLMLARTSRYFHANINPRTCLPEAEQRRFMMLVDTYKHNTSLWACHKCYRMLPIHAFSNRMRTLKSGKHGNRLTRNGNRACIECSIRHRLFAHLVAIKKGDLLYYFCWQCGRFETASYKCQVIRVGEGDDRAKVTICWDIKDRTPGPKKFAPIETLPESVMKRIVSHLDYRHAIRLGKTSHHMLEVVNPAALVPLHERFAYVRSKWNHDFGRIQRRDVRQYEALACFVCLRIRGINKFPRKQIELSNTYPDTYWKRRCGMCVERMYRTPNNAELREFRNRRQCRFCEALRDKNEPCGGCLDKFARGEIDQIPEEEVLEVDYQDNLEGIVDMFHEEESPSQSDDRIYQRQKAGAEKSPYRHIRARVQGRRKSRSSQSHSPLAAFFRRIARRKTTEADYEEAGCRIF